MTYFVEDVRSIAEDSATGLVSLSIKWTDPDLAFNWAEDFVRRANQRLRSQDLESSERRLAYLNAELEKANLVELRTAIFGLIESEIQAKMFAQVEDEYVFKVIDPPRVPSKPVAPNKILIVFLAAFFGFAVSVFFILFSAAISYDPNNKVSV